MISQLHNNGIPLSEPLTHVLQPVQRNFWTRKVMEIGPRVISALGKALVAVGTGMMIWYAKKATLITGACLTLFGVTFLCAGIQATEVQQQIGAQLDAVSMCEQEGTYKKALNIARDGYNASRNLGLCQQEEQFSQAVIRLENAVLHTGATRLFFDEKYRPKVKLLNLLHLVGMDKSLKTIEQINDWAQKNLLRQSERWETQTNTFETLKSRIQPLLTDLGCIEAVLPSFTTYEGAIVHGALLSRVRLRLHYLIEQWKKGVRLSRLYFLSGERPLEIQFENRTTLLNDKDSPLKIRKEWKEPQELPKTESEMVQMVWEQSEVPDDMRKSVTVHYISAPMKKDCKRNTMVRPTTDDTVEAWKKDFPPIGRYVAVTNAPYISRQDFVTRTIASKEYGFDTIGPGTSDQEKMAIVLDEIARTVFQIKQIKEKQKTE